MGRVVITRGRRNRPLSDSSKYPSFFENDDFGVRARDVGFQDGLLKNRRRRREWDNPSTYQGPTGRVPFGS